MAVTVSQTSTVILGNEKITESITSLRESRKRSTKDRLEVGKAFFALFTEVDKHNDNLKTGEKRISKERATALTGWPRTTAYRWADMYYAYQALGWPADTLLFLDAEGLKLASLAKAIAGKQNMADGLKASFGQTVMHLDITTALDAPEGEKSPAETLIAAIKQHIQPTIAPSTLEELEGEIAQLNEALMRPKSPSEVRINAEALKDAEAKVSDIYVSRLTALLKSVASFVWPEDTEDHAEKALQNFSNAPLKQQKQMYSDAVKLAASFKKVFEAKAVA